MTKRYLLSHDLGTSGNKATLFTSEGELVASAVHSYGTDYFNTTWAEQNPDDWWNAVCLSTKELMRGRDAAGIGAIALSGQMMGCLCVDRNGKPLRNSLIYCDQRSEPQIEKLQQRIGMEEVYGITGHRASSSYSLGKLMWIMENESDLYARTYKMLHAKDYINFKLTGRMVTEFTDASGTNLLDLKRLVWSEKLINASGIDGDKLPDLAASTDIVGEVTDSAAEELGIVSGIPVAAGAGDGLCAGVGVGSVTPGMTYNYLGSSSWIATTTKEPMFDPEMRTFVWAHAVPGYYHPCGTMQTAGSSFSWLKDQICLAETQQGEAAGKSPYELINDRAEESPPGARGLHFLPYLLGERSPRWNPEAKGAFLGLTMQHTRDDVIRSVIEGIILNLDVILAVIRKFVDVKEITVIGGSARSAFWRRLMADIYEAAILMPNYLEEATAMGAAIIGGVGTGIFTDFSAIEKFIKIESKTEPDYRNTAVYMRKKDIFEKCYAALTDIFPLIGRTEKE